MQSPTSKDKDLIGMPLQIGTPGGIQSENPSCIRVSGNFRASSEHPLRKFQDHLRYVQKLVFCLVSHLQSRLVSCLSCLVSHLLSCLILCLVYRVSSCASSRVSSCVSKSPDSWTRPYRQGRTGRFVRAGSCEKGRTGRAHAGQHRTGRVVRAGL